jgi:hypothetical protein
MEPPMPATLQPAQPAPRPNAETTGLHVEAAEEGGAETNAEAADLVAKFPTAFWYRIGDSQPRVVRAATERAALAKVQARHPEASAKRVWLHPYGAP